MLLIVFSNSSGCVSTPMTRVPCSTRLMVPCLSSPAAYGLAACLLLGGVNAFWPQFLGTLVQAVGSGAVFTVLALAWTGQAVKPGSLPTARADFSTRLVPRVENFPLPNALERCYPILTRGGIVMKRVKITVLKTTLDRELAEEYGAEGLTACPMLREGRSFTPTTPSRRLL